jgi:transposase
VHDWAEVHRLHERERLSQRTIARRLGMSRNTVARLLGSEDAPRYQRLGRGSILDPFKGEIAVMLAQDAKAPATVIIRELRRLGYAGGITILKEHLASARTEHLAVQTYQRTSYLPGEICQVDWWSPGIQVPVGKGASREVHGLVAQTLPGAPCDVSVKQDTPGGTL